MDFISFLQAGKFSASSPFSNSRTSARLIVNDLVRLLEGELNLHTSLERARQSLVTVYGISPSDIFDSLVQSYAGMGGGTPSSVSSISAKGSQ